MTDVLRIENVGATQVWTVHRPEARNAIDGRVVSALEHAVHEVERDRNVRCVVLTGAGDVAFISGADLKGLRTMAADVRGEIDARMHKLLARFEALPVPIIAALNGVVMGGGAEIMLACDMRIAEKHASVTFKHAAMGVTPGWGGLARLSTLVGRGIASKLLFTALPMNAEESLRVGLVDEVVDAGRSKARALELAQAVDDVSPTSVAEMKHLISLTYSEGGEASRHAERSVFLERAKSEDHAEALKAFFEKRAAVFGPRPR